MKILIILSSSMGNMLLATPLLRCIRNQLPDSGVHLLTSRLLAPAISVNPYIDKSIFREDDHDALLLNLQTENYDFIIDLDDDSQSRGIKKTLKKKSSTIPKVYVRPSIFTILKLRLLPHRHLTPGILNAARQLGIKDDGLGLDFFIPPGCQLREDDLPHSHIAGFVAIVITATHFTSRMPVHKMKELCSIINFPIILTGEKSDFDYANEISSSDEVKIYNACGKFNLYETADILRKSRVVISMDTDLMYLACALNKPLLVLWGSTSPCLLKGPYYGSNFMSKNPDIYENIFLNLWCQPCSHHGLSSCPLGHFNCMQKQDTSYIAKRTMEMTGKFPLAV